eukprot:m.204225 g.204225  ORF g.204225 m.204225 type:complete len:726 (-) comp16882_c4_seq5:242-2419(-)
MKESLVQSYVVKQGNIRKAWRRRWMTLRPNGELEYRVDIGRPVRGVIHMREVLEIVRPEDCSSRKQWPHAEPKWPRVCLENTAFALITKKRTYYMYTLTPRENFAWISQLERVQFEIANQEAAPRHFTKSFEDTKTVKIPAVLPDGFQDALNKALETPKKDTFDFHGTNFAAFSDHLIVSTAQTSIPYGSTRPRSVDIMHVLCQRSTIIGITLQTCPTIVEGINFAATITVHHLGQETPLIMYLPGRRTYDPAGQTADLDKATIRIGTHTARLLTHISAILISCCLHGACEDAIQQQLQSQLADVMEQTDSRQWLFRWMYEQILCTFIRRQQAMSYGAFLQAAADNHEFDLTAEGHQHSKTYLESRGNGPNDGQPPAEYFIQQAYAEDMQHELTADEQLVFQKLKCLTLADNVQAFNPVEAQLQGRDLLVAALQGKPTGRDSRAVAGWYLSNDSERPEISATRDSFNCTPSHDRDQVRHSSTLVYFLNSPIAAESATPSCCLEGAVSIQPTKALPVARWQGRRDDWHLSFSSDGAIVDGINFAASLVVQAGDGPSMSLWLPGIRTYDPAGISGDIHASERVDKEFAEFQLGVFTSLVFAALHGASQAQLSALHEAFEPLMARFYGRHTLYQWIYHQVTTAMLMTTTPLSYAAYIKKTGVADSIPRSAGSHLHVFLLTLEAGRPHFPATYLAKCFKEENLGAVLSLREARLLEWMVREMDNNSKDE